MALTDVYSYKYAKDKLDSFLEEQEKIMKSQEYRIANRTQKRALLSEVEAVIGKWEKIVEEHIRLDSSLSATPKKKVRRGPTVRTLGYRS